MKMCDDEETAALVIDNGSGMCKVSANSNIEDVFPLNEQKNISRL